MQEFAESASSGVGRIMALDVGKRRIGIAVSDALGITAQGLRTLQRSRIREDMDAMSALAREWQVYRFVLGFPLHMSGRESRQSGYVQEFGDRLQAHTGVPVEYWDERLTSVAANRVLKESGMSIEKRARAVDQLAAVLLLESYLERMQG